ncbi:hypothetical protein IA539_21655 [Gordonia sp. zg691]|uniref:hypothetical protein n=1 Tax=Gordonia jinghuaiqii TaxID=2758710 RepID=UPI00166224F9|nr:hypothetical protein [Gordonia jinghuaiqii]MBD0863785.1 hypothetical protein [Gordonia jinghuaiqii]
MNLYIPAEEVVNVETTGIPGRVPNAGDHRGPSASADAEDSRVSVYVDYETGIVFVRQNPTVERDSDRRPRAGIPEVRVGQDRNGAVKIVYNAKDSFQPALADQIDIGVQGSITVDPSTGIPSVRGQVTPYPAIEIYHHSPEGTTTELFERNVNGSPYGPMTQLLRRATEHIGSEDVPHVGPVPDTERHTGRAREPFGTELGAPHDPPDVRVY